MMYIFKALSAVQVLQVRSNRQSSEN